MIPLRDNIPARTIPVVNYAVIGLCAAMFLLQLAESARPEPVMVERLGMIPARLTHPGTEILVSRLILFNNELVKVVRPAAEPLVHPWLTLVTCVFLHGGWLHFLGNMWFLFIFGDNVEDRIGHVGYALFYLGCGVAASAAHLLFNGSSTVPTIGASGAIAGVMGAYMLLYPKAQVLSAVPIFYFLQVVVLPAPLFLGIWFVMQFFHGVASVGATEATGVAWWAHIGGFAAGFLVALMLKSVGETKPPVEERRYGLDHSGVYRYPRRPYE